MTLEELPSLSLDKDTFYFVSPWGLGDTMILCGLKPALEQKLGGKIHLVVKPSHEVIMKMYGYSDYTLAKTFHFYPHHSPTLICLATRHPYPQKGCFYVAHPEFHAHCKSLVSDMQTRQPRVRFLSWYKQFFGLPENTDFILPNFYPSVSRSLQERFLHLAPGISLDRTVLILPEATTVVGFPRLFWEILIAQQKKLGFFVISNIVSSNMPLFEGVPNIDLSLEELVALSLACKDVFALRSGICDLLFSKKEHLHVFYPNNAILRVFSLKEMFQSNEVDEISLEESSSGIQYSVKQGILTKKITTSFQNDSFCATTGFYVGKIPLFSIQETIK